MVIHIVKEGETLFSIAGYYGVSVSRIRSDNGLKEGERLVVGQALLITLASEKYTVKENDTLSGIASEFSVSENTLLQNNPFIITGGIYPGLEITVSFRSEKRRSIETNGYAYPHIDRFVLEKSLPYLTYLSVFSYGFRESGELIVPDDSLMLSLAEKYRAVPVMVLTTVNENGVFSTEKASALFFDKDYQRLVVDNIISAMLNKGYRVLDVDFEYVASEEKEAYIEFLSYVAERLHLNNLYLFVALAPKTYADQPGLLYEAHDYSRIGEIADNVLLMTYEWGYTYGPPMAVAPINQVRRVVAYGVSEIEADKIHMGIPNYAYDWTLPYEKGVSKAQSIGNERAITIASEYGSPILYDEAAQTPYFEYRRDGREHVVWFEDVRSINQKLLLCDEFSLSGVGYWNIMRPFAQNYMLLAVNYDIKKL